MSIRKYATIKPLIPADLATELGSKAIIALLKLVRDAYFDLIEKQLITETMDENDITEEWIVCFQLRWQYAGLNLVIIHEKGDDTKKKSNRGKPPTIDCCLRHQWDKRSYFGIECKLIEANDKTLCDKYVENGIMRFVDCRYSSICTEGAMLGYVRATKYVDVAKQLRTRIMKLDGHPNFERTDHLLPFREHYVSVHARSDCISPFKLNHFLLQF